MTEANVTEPDTGSALEVGQHGGDVIDESGRCLRPRQLFPFWRGSSVSAQGFVAGGGIYWALEGRRGPAGVHAPAMPVPVPAGKPGAE